MTSSRNGPVTSFIALILILFACYSTATARKTLPEKINIVVEGMVYCQTCDLKDLKPVSSATVKLRCINYSEFINFDKLLKTDANGYFFVKMEGFQIGHTIWGDPQFACQVRLVSSPLRTCNSPHVSVVSLRYQNKVYKDHEARIYATRPMTFRPSGCPGN